MPNSDLLEVDWDKATAIGATAEIYMLMNAGVFKATELHQCYNCGYQSTDEGDFVEINVEEPRFGMDDPYPGYGGDTACLDCAGGTNELD